MLNHRCRVSGCGAPAASRFAAYCANHRNRNRRHGAPNQDAITKAQLKHHLRRVKARIAKNAHSPAWWQLEERWRALIDHSKGIMAGYYSGRAGVGYERRAAEEVIKLGNDVEPRQVLETVAAMVMMQEFEPRRFRSDRAFWIQLARRLRALTDMNFGERYNHQTRKVRRCYREFSPRAAEVLGRWLAQTLGTAGLHLARLEQAEHDKKAKERQELGEALAKLV
jgi:hypothetical protein